MIGDRHAWGSKGYSILEEGQIDRTTLTLKVERYLVCRPDGEALEQGYPSLEAAREAIDQLESTGG